MKRVLMAALVLAILPAGLDAQVRGRRNLRQDPARTQLQRQVVQRFVDVSSRELGLTTQERNRIEQILLEHNERRDELFTQGVELRRRLAQAVRNPATPDSEIEAILNEMIQLREREHELWRSEQEEFAHSLPPRKRAQMMMRLLRLQERIREIIEQRPAGARADTSGIGRPF